MAAFGQNALRLALGMSPLDENLRPRFYEAMNSENSLKLPEGYTCRVMEGEEFHKLWQPEAELMFHESQLMYHSHVLYSEEENEKLKKLQEAYSDIFRLRLGVFYQDEFVAWSWGYQENRELYYMCNSGVKSEHRRKGIYAFLLQENIRLLKDKGFQRIYSRHTTTNNQVIIPKLKAGFFVSGMELNDHFGSLVHLTYYVHPVRRKVMDFRAGQIRPDAQIKELFDL